jgi:hypothetical protein
MVFLLHDWLRPSNGQDFQHNQLMVIFLALTFHGVLFVWQVVGTIRASEAYIKSSGFLAPVLGTQLALAGLLFWVLTYTLDAWQMTLPVPDDLQTRLDFEAERAAKYSIEPSEDGLSLVLTGSLERGISDHLKKRLQANPNVSQIVLDSAGGNIFEARGLSNIVRENALNTLVISKCSSACTTVFIAGIERRLASSGKLGFHQIRIDATYPVLNASPLQQQDRDRAIFLQSGVAAWFLDVMYDKPATEMWYPTLTELVDARVVTSATP